MLPNPANKDADRFRCQCSSGKPALGWARGAKVLFAITAALGHETHRPSVLQHERLLWFLVGLFLPGVLLLPIVSERGVVLQLWVHGLGWGVLCVVLLLEAVPK